MVLLFGGKNITNMLSKTDSHALCHKWTNQKLYEVRIHSARSLYLLFRIQWKRENIHTDKTYNNIHTNCTINLWEWNSILCVQKRNDKQNHDNYNEPAFFIIISILFFFRYFSTSREKRKKINRKTIFFVCVCNGEFVGLVLDRQRKWAPRERLS